MNASHPDKRWLVEYSTGALDDERAHEVARHLDECTECDATIRSLEAAGDTFVAGLRKPPQEQPLLQETPYLKTVEAALQIANRPEPKSSPARVESQPMSTAGKLGPYVLLEKLGEGGMGAVFKARHEHLDKIVAIKVLPKKAMQDPAAVARFRREMKAVGALHHPNIVGAHDAGEAQGVHFLVMEYVAGSDLSSRIRKNGPVTVEQAISYVAQAAKGLAFAHAKNIVHRDIKPANLLVDGEGTVKILDLGLARLDDGSAANTEANQGLTQTGQVMGTVDYMAPEQAFDTHRADAKADVYSLGCTLYRILTGENAFRGETVVQKILAHREQSIPPLAKSCPTAPAALDAIYQRMMAKRPEDRPTMAEVVKEFEAIANPHAAAANAPAIVIDVQKAPAAMKAEASKKPAARAPQTGGSNRGSQPPVKLIAGGIGGFALVLCGVIWFVIRDKDGNELARVAAPEGSTVQAVSGAVAAKIKPSPVAVPPVSTPRVATSLTDVNSPAFQAWLKATQALPAEKQVEAVSKKLMELNPGFDGKLTHPGKAPPKIENGTVTELKISPDGLTDLSPLRACQGLKVLHLFGTPGKGTLSDLSPLQGMQLTSFTLAYTKVTDITPLAGMPLTFLNTDVKISDLSFLHGMPLKKLYAGNSSLTDLSPLRGMPLEHLYCWGTQVSDLSPLAECKNLKLLAVTRTKVTSEQVASLQKALPNCKIDWDDPTKTPAKQLAYLDPAFQQWIEATQKLSAEQQLEAVSKKLMELNPGFDGVFTGYSRKDAVKIEGGVVKELGFITDNVTDLSPVRALTGLQVLGCGGTSPSSGKLSDLSPLGGMPLTKLTFGSSQVSDLTALRGMPLTRLEFHYSQVSDLSPLAGMPLDYLNCGGSPRLSDLSPLKQTTLTNLICSNCKELASLAPLQGVRLTSLACSLTQVADLSPLAECKDLKSLSVVKTKVTAEQVASLQKALPDCKITWDDPTKTSAKPLAYLDPAFQQWVEATQKLPAEKQLEEVSKKLMELNPGFDGKLEGMDGQWGSPKGTPTVSIGVVTKLGFISDQITDISPVRALAGLTQLSCRGSTGDASRLSDLSPLKGMKLTFFGCANTRVSDLSPLAGMPLTRLWCGGTNDLSDLTPLRGLPLTMLTCRSAPVSDLSPLQGMPLTYLDLTSCKVSDLAPLKAMPIAKLFCIGTAVSDLSPLEGCRNLESVGVTKTKVTAEQVAALQKALPNCKIDWDDPAKGDTSQSAQPASTPEPVAPAKE